MRLDFYTGTMRGQCFVSRKSGGESRKVGELRSVVVFEMEAYPEPKVLSAANLRENSKDTMTIKSLADRTGLSWSAVQERLRPGRVWNPELKRFVRVNLRTKKRP